MTQALIAHPFDTVTYHRPASPVVLTHPGQAQGVYITLHPDLVEDTAATFGQWFARRPEVCVVDIGTSDKAGLGFLLLEWRECAIDPLFLDILAATEAIADYTCYGRTLEE